MVLGGVRWHREGSCAALEGGERHSSLHTLSRYLSRAA